jgi:hypothetical protein
VFAGPRRHLQTFLRAMGNKSLRTWTVVNPAILIRTSTSFTRAPPRRTQLLPTKRNFRAQGLCEIMRNKPPAPEGRSRRAGIARGASPWTITRRNLKPRRGDIAIAVCRCSPRTVTDRRNGTFMKRFKFLPSTAAFFLRFVVFPGKMRRALVSGYRR